MKILVGTLVKILEASTRKANGMLDKDLMLHLAMVIAEQITIPRGIYHESLTVLGWIVAILAHLKPPFSFFLVLLYAFQMSLYSYLWLPNDGKDYLNQQ